MTTKREQILALAISIGAEKHLLFESYHLSLDGLEAFYHAARKPLKEENERLREALAITDPAPQEKKCCDGGPQWGHALNCQMLP